MPVSTIRTAIALLVVAAILASSLSASGASNNAVVSATVVSATSINAAGCAPGSSAATNFGTVLPGSTAVTSADCSVAFGSSNDTARLVIRQRDRTGDAMYSPSRGVLDSSFSGNGAAVAGYGFNDSAARIIRYDDGRILASGMCYTAASKYRMCFARLLVDGSPDPAFGAGGVVDVQTNAIDDGWPTTESLKLLPDGRIMAGGLCAGNSSNEDSCIVRLLSDGTLDPSLDGDGVLRTDVPGVGGQEFDPQVVAFADGSFTVHTYCAAGGFDDRCSASFTPTGTLNTNYDGDGRHRFRIDPSADYDMPIDAHLDGQGRIVVVGTCDRAASWEPQLCVSRQTSNGALDPSFDGDGRGRYTFVDLGQDAEVMASTIDGEGRIVAAAVCRSPSTPSTVLCVIRVNPDGSLDTSFAGDGSLEQRLETRGYIAWDDLGVATDELDNVVVAHTCDNGANDTACLLRISSSGVLDTTMGTNGVTKSEVGAPGTRDSSQGVTTGPDGSIFQLGNCVEGASTSGMCVYSLKQHGRVLQYADDGARDWDTPGTAASGFGVCLRSATGGAAAMWPSTGSCVATDGTSWRDVDTVGESVASTSALEPDPVDATAHFRFGLRTTAAQPPGLYVAPITFTVVAPAV